MSNLRNKNKSKSITKHNSRSGVTHNCTPHYSVAYGALASTKKAFPYKEWAAQGHTLRFSKSCPRSPLSRRSRALISFPKRKPAPCKPSLSFWEWVAGQLARTLPAHSPCITHIPSPHRPVLQAEENHPAQDSLPLLALPAAAPSFTTALHASFAIPSITMTPDEAYEEIVMLPTITLPAFEDAHNPTEDDEEEDYSVTSDILLPAQESPESADTTEDDDDEDYSVTSDILPPLQETAPISIPKNEAPIITLPVVEIRPVAASTSSKQPPRKLEVISAARRITQETSRILGTFKDDVTDITNRTLDIISLYQLRHEHVLGIDITPQCIYVCEIDSVNGKRLLTSLNSVCMEGKFVTDDILKDKAAYAKSLRALIHDNNIQTKNVALSIPVANSIVRTVTLPRMDDNEIKKALKFGSLWEQFTNPGEKQEDYSIFYQIVRRKKNEEMMQVLFVATRLSDIRLYTDIIKESGLNPVIVDVRCFAVSEAFRHQLSQGKHTDPVMFIELGMEEAYATIIDDGRSYVTGLRLSERERAGLKDSTTTEEIISFIATNVARQLRSCIRDYEKSVSDGRVYQIFTTTSCLSAQRVIDKVVKLLDDYTVSECNLFDCMSIEDDFTVDEKSARHPISAWAASIGMGLRRLDIFGTKHAANNNLLASAGGYESTRRTAHLLNVAASAACVAVLYFIANTHAELAAKNSELTEQLAQYNGVEATYDTLYAEEQSLTAEQQQIAHIRNLLIDVASNQLQLQRMHEYLNLVILDNVWLRDLKFTAPDKFEISGASTTDESIVRFINLLNEGEQFEKVSLRSMQEIREAHWETAQTDIVKTFKLEGTLSKVDLPISDPGRVKLIAVGDPNAGS